MSRRLVLGIMIVAAIIGSRWLLRDEGAPPRELPEAESEYRLQDFELTVMNRLGEPRYVIDAPLLVRDPADGSATVSSPDIRLFENGRETWTVIARQGWVGESGAEVRLLGEVTMESIEADPTTVRTETLTILPDEDRARTDDHVMIAGPRGHLEGVGLRARLDRQAWELLSEVSATLLPSRS